MDALDLQDVRRFAEDLARHASLIARSHQGDMEVQRKADGSPVTEADRRVQRYITKRVHAEYPDHGFVGEEDVDAPDTIPNSSESEYCWVVDPIDGTRNFTTGFPVRATSIGVLHQGVPVVGVVCEHLSGWCCTAVVGGGVCCDGQPARVSDRKVGRDTMIAVPTGRHQPVLPVIRDWTDRYVLRNVGSTALHLAYVACGAVDAAFCCECKLWDVAAGVLLVTEGGGKCTDHEGREIFPAAAALPIEQNHPFFAASPTAFDALFADFQNVRDHRGGSHA